MKRARLRHALVALPLWLATTMTAGLLHAGDPPAGAAPAGPGVATNAQVSATAEALFEQGRLLMKDKKYGEACPKLNESLRIDPALGTMLYLADCYEKNGQTASAWATFSDAVAAARSAAQGDRELKAKLRVQNLVPKLVKLTLTLAPENAAVAGLEIKRDGIVIGAALLGTPIPVDPGEHAIEVSAPGKLPWSSIATVPSKPGSVVALVVPRLDDVPPPPPAPEPTVTATASATAPPPLLPTATATAKVIVPPPLPPPPDTTVRTAGLLVGGAGLVGVVVASILGVSAKSQNDEALAKYCDGTFCTDQKGIELTDSAKGLAMGSTVAFAIGGVALAAGAGMLVYSFVAKPTTGPATGKLTSRDVRQSLPRDVRQSLPRDVRQSLPRDVRQSLPRIVVGPGSLTVVGRF